MRKTLLLLSASAVVALPAVLSAQPAGRPLNPREVAEARQQHPQLVAEFGGAETGARGAYAQSVGRRVAAFSGTPNAAGAYNFTVLNSPVENAFAVPGGYVYITRQLMALMDNEAELAFALGHEVGHIAANHSQARRSTATRNSVLGVLGAVLGSVIGSNVFGDLISRGAQQAAQLSTLGFSRNQEYQADTLGMRYILSAGYDPAGAPGILAALGRASALEARVQGRDQRQMPEWASTHPMSENRVQRALVDAQRTGRLNTGIRNRDVFLNQLEGMYVGDDPVQGVIEGRTFRHPDLRIFFAVPPGYLMQNSTRAVSIKGSAGQAQFSGGRSSGSLENYTYRVLQELTGGRQQLAMQQPQRTMVNGIPAVYTLARANTRSGAVDVGVVAFQWAPGTVYHYVTMTRAGYGLGPFASMISSTRHLSPAEAAAIRPRVIDVVTVAPGDTIQSLASRMAYGSFQLERFMALNGLSGSTRLTPGQKVKLVVYGARRA
jgi:predicted Zn-dependent protease